MTIKQATANRIIDLCKQNDITLNKLSIICGINQSTLNNIVNHGSNNPTITTIKKICDGLDITLSDFFSVAEFDELEQEIM